MADTSSRSFSGVWDDQAVAAPDPTLDRMEEAARTGKPMAFVIDLDGLQYCSVVRVSKLGPGNFQCRPVAPVRRHLLVTFDPRRLPV